MCLRLACRLLKTNILCTNWYKATCKTNYLQTVNEESKLQPIYALNYIGNSKNTETYKCVINIVLTTEIPLEDLTNIWKLSKLLSFSHDALKLISFKIFHIFAITEKIKVTFYVILVYYNNKVNMETDFWKRFTRKIWQTKNIGEENVL